MRADMIRLATVNPRTSFFQGCLLGLLLGGAGVIAFNALKNLKSSDSPPTLRAQQSNTPVYSSAPVANKLYYV
jgi:hypothetical protein